MPWSRGIVGYGEFVAPDLWGSEEVRSGVKENLRRRQENSISIALHEQQVLAAQLLKQAEASVKKAT